MIVHQRSSSGEPSGWAMLEHTRLVYVKRIKAKGRGVFAKEPITKGSTIEKVPVLIIPSKEFRGQEETTLGRYVYCWGEDMAVSLGYGSLYNHSYEPNARYEHGPNTITYIALRDIAKDEEITINYNFSARSKRDVGFKVV